jgi:hypothetical protein
MWTITNTGENSNGVTPVFWSHACLLSTGVESWPDAKLVFVKGDKLVYCNPPADIKLSGSVEPQQTVTVSVTFEAPVARPEPYERVYQLRAAGLCHPPYANA